MTLKRVIIKKTMNACDLEWDAFLNGGDILSNDAVDIASFNHINSKETGENMERNIDIPRDLMTDINISTMTKITFLNRPIDLKRDFWKMIVKHYYTKEECIIKKQMKYVIESDEEQEYFNTMIESQERVVELMDLRKKNIIGTNKKTGMNIYKVSIGLRTKDIISHKTKKTQAFYNCFVLILRLKNINDPSTFMEAHIKVFNTGKLEIPGMKSHAMFEYVLEVFKRIYEESIGEQIDYNKENVETILINSNFNCGFYIDRSKFYYILKNKYNLNCSLDPCTYPGIQNIFYYDKTSKSIDFNGVMNSETKTHNSKKRKSGKDYVSFMVFRTGSILIVGKCDEEILLKVYEFVKNVLVNEYEEINSGLIENEVEEEKKTKKQMKENKTYRTIKHTSLKIKGSLYNEK